MKRIDLAAAISLMKRGRFRDAALHLRNLACHPQDPTYVMHQALLADALQLTGDSECAERISNDISKIRNTSPSALAKCHTVLGAVCRDRGQLADSIFHFKKAVSLAESSGDKEQECWASLRLMAAAGEENGVETAIGMLPDVRSRVTRLGDPIVLATFHLWVAEFESKRGLLLAASRHIQAARSILREHHNDWLEGSAAIDDFCVSFLKSDIESAFSYASDALRLANLSGHAPTRMAACTNLAHIHLVLGELQEATNFFNEALSCCQTGGANEIAILDGLAQLELTRGNFGKCEEILNEIDRIAGRTSLQPYYYQSWSFKTRLELLICQEKIQEALVFLKGLDTSCALFHPSLRIHLRILHAEILVLSGRPEEATSNITEALCDYDGNSIDVFAEIERVLGRTFVACSDSNAAVRHFERSARILATARNTRARTKVLKTYISALPAEDRGEGVPSTTSGFDVTFQNLRPVSEPPQLTGCFDRVFALLELTEHPELVGYETFELLRELNCADRLVFAATCENQAPEILASCGCELESALEMVRTKSERLHTGSTRGKDLWIVLLVKPDLASQINFAGVRKVVNAVLELQSLRREVNERGALWPLDDPVSCGDAVFAAEPMVRMLTTIRKIAPSNLTVLLTGETGTGKEVLARVLHETSTRANKAFLPFNCAAVPRDLIESQLFGYRRGAFSGAHAHFEGVIPAAAGGTLFLDEIGEIGLDVQAKLLRFLESGEIHPLGEVRPTKVDVRVVAASNANLDQLVAQGRFREDLFYRLNVIRFRIPALRERREEIPLLVQHFFRRYSAEFIKSDLCIAEETMEYLLLYEWPGNVRQLANEIKRLVALAENRAVLMPEHLSPEIAASRRTVPAFERPAASFEVVVRLDQSLSAAVRHLERSMLLHALQTTQGRVELAAKELGLSRKGLYLKRQRLGLSSIDSIASVTSSS